MEQPAVSAIVLAGGASSRMGSNKALARLRQGRSGQGTTLIELAVSKASVLSTDVIVAANDPILYGNLGARVTPDVYPGAGSLGGIYSGLLAARHQHALVFACDMPFLSLRLWRHLLELPRDYDVLIPRRGGHLEPLHAIYSRRCLKPMRELLENGNLKVVGVLDRVKVRFIDDIELTRYDPEQRSFFNVNTPEDLDRADQMAQAFERWPTAGGLS